MHTFDRLIMISISLIEQPGRRIDREKDSKEDDNADYFLETNLKLAVVVNRHFAKLM